MNGDTTIVAKNHTPMVVICVTILASQAALTGAFLLWKGFAGGGELVVTLNTAISGLIGFLGGRATAPVKAADLSIEPPNQPVPVVPVPPAPQPNPNP